jgi:hypothetical protein
VTLPESSLRIQTLLTTQPAACRNCPGQRSPECPRA